MRNGPLIKERPVDRTNEIEGGPQRLFFPFLLFCASVWPSLEERTGHNTAKEVDLQQWIEMSFLPSPSSSLPQAVMATLGTVSEPPFPLLRLPLWEEVEVDPAGRSVSRGGGKEKRGGGVQTASGPSKGRESRFDDFSQGPERKSYLVALHREGGRETASRNFKTSSLLSCEEEKIK